MKLGELVKNINIIESAADSGTNITGISYNSSDVRSGELFVAIKGYKTDGHMFIEDAVKKGAVCVVCLKKPDIDVPYILTEDTRSALAIISSAWFSNPASKLKLIGVTGTNGKTSVTYMIKHIIEKCTNSKTGLIGTIGNLIGSRELGATHTTPDSYELHSILNKMVFEGCKYVVMEVSSHALSLLRVHGITFDIGIFTNLTPEHLDFHKSMDEYAQAKAQLFLNSRNSVINTDNDFSQVMRDKSRGKVLTYAAENGDAEVRADNIEFYPDKTVFDINYANEKSRITVHIPGMFTVYNALAAYCAAQLLGIDKKGITDALGSFEGVKGRAEVLKLDRDYTVLVDYAHTPDALKNIIQTARGVTDGRVVTLFGCGGDRDKEKRPLMGKIAAQLSDIVIITTDNPRTEDPQVIINDILAGVEEVIQTDRSGPTEERRLIVIENRREAIYKALEILLARDVLIVAGKGHETYQIIGNEKHHFDDREVVDDYFKIIRENKRKVRQGA